MNIYLLHWGHILNGTLAHCDTHSVTLDCILALKEDFSLVDIDERLRILPRQKIILLRQNSIFA